MKKEQTDIILALDLPGKEAVEGLLAKVGSEIRWVKIGLQLFLQYGPSIVKRILDLGYEVFLDLKLHDIPSQVASSIKRLASLPIGMLTLHTSGGEEMMKWAKRACQEMNHTMQLLGVTVLTSMDLPSLKAIGVENSIEKQVLKLGQLGVNAGIDGFVCAPCELELLRTHLPKTTTLVTPGIRIGTQLTEDEQKRVMRPEQAVAMNASYLVIGRPIYQANDPKGTVISIKETILKASTQP